jgi:hypothetical protein
MSRNSVAALGKGMTITRALRLVAKHLGNAESIKLTWTEYY